MSYSVSEKSSVYYAKALSAIVLCFLLNISNNVSMALNAKFCSVHLNPDYSNLHLFISVY